MYYLALDIETGGIGYDKSLLSLFMATLDENYQIKSELELKIKPDNGIYHVTAEAMSINRIDLVEHNKTAVTYKEAGTQVYNFLNAASRLTIKQLIPLGHGVAFDCAFLKNTIISEGSWNKFVSYRALDTCSIARFMMLTDKLPELSGSLESLVKHFGIKPMGHLHDAKTDVIASIEVFKRLFLLNLNDEDEMPVAEVKNPTNDTLFERWQQSEKQRQEDFIKYTTEIKSLKEALNIRAHQFQCPDCGFDLWDDCSTEEHDEDCPHYQTEKSLK